MKEKKELKDVTKVSGKLKSTEEKITEQSFTTDNVTRSIKVREVENGFIVEIREEGNGKDWYWNTQTWISTENPLDSNNDDINEIQLSVQDTIKSALAKLKL